MYISILGAAKKLVWRWWWVLSSSSSRAARFAVKIYSLLLLLIIIMLFFYFCVRSRRVAVLIRRSKFFRIAAAYTTCCNSHVIWEQKTTSFHDDACSFSIMSEGEKNFFLSKWTFVACSWFLFIRTESSSKRQSSFIKIIWRWRLRKFNSCPLFGDARRTNKKVVLLQKYSSALLFYRIL